MKQHMESDGIWRTRFERLFDREYDEKLALASNWKQLYKWQRASISYTGKIVYRFLGDDFCWPSSNFRILELWFR